MLRQVSNLYTQQKYKAKSQVYKKKNYFFFFIGTNKKYFKLEKLFSITNNFYIELEEVLNAHICVHKIILKNNMQKKKESIKFKIAFRYQKKEKYIPKQSKIASKYESCCNFQNPGHPVR